MLMVVSPTLIYFVGIQNKTVQNLCCLLYGLCSFCRAARWLKLCILLAWYHPEADNVGRVGGCIRIQAMWQEVRFFPSPLKYLNIWPNKGIHQLSLRKADFFCLKYTIIQLTWCCHLYVFDILKSFGEKAPSWGSEETFEGALRLIASISYNSCQLSCLSLLLCLKWCSIVFGLSIFPLLVLCCLGSLLSRGK